MAYQIRCDDAVVQTGFLNEVPLRFFFFDFFF